MVDYPHIQATHNNTYVLLKDFEAHGVVVPAGYETNGADVPQAFWWVIPPFKPKYMHSIVVHDYLCDLSEYVLADEIFEKMLFEVEISFKTKAMVFFVKIYHNVKYKGG